MVRGVVSSDLLFLPVFLVLLRTLARCYVKGRVSLLVILVAGFIGLVDLGQNVIRVIHCSAGGRWYLDFILMVFLNEALWLKNLLCS